MTRTSRKTVSGRAARRLARLGVEPLEGRALPTTIPIGPVYSPQLPAETTPLPPGASEVVGTAEDQSTSAWAAADFAGLASFSVPGSVLAAGPFQVAITWGDGSTGQALPEADASGGLTIVPTQQIDAAEGADPDATYTIAFDASHTYTQAGTYAFTATLYFGNNPTPLATAGGTVSVGPGNPADFPSFTATAPDLTATAGVPITLPATFDGPTSAIDDGYYTADVSFGDGSAGGSLDETVWQPGDVQTTVDYAYGHAYQTPGTYTYAVTLLIQGTPVATATGTVTVVAADPTNPVITASAPDLAATAGEPVDLAASFTGPDLAIGLGFFRATTSFGDGSPDEDDTGFGMDEGGGQITFRFDVPHAYQAPGTYPYHVVFLSDGVTVAIASGTVTVVAAEPGDPAPTSGTPVTSSGEIPDPVAVPAVQAQAPVATIALAPQAGAPVVAPAASALPESAEGPNPLLGGPAFPIVVTGGVIPDIDLAGLWAGLFTTTGAPSTGSNVAAPSLAGAPSSPSDPLQFDVTYWDAGLKLQTT